VKILIDMNLSPEWADLFREHGHESRHWSEVGVASAPDTDLLQWAARESHIILTHDLDFGDILAASRAQLPSVIILRAADVQIETLGLRVVDQLRDFEQELNRGAILVIDTINARLRVLPIH
jgi:predicted nuclease of predicted toxin-antitoxin system